MPKRVLIVEDEEPILASLCFLMGQSGYEAHAARDGEQALGLAASLRPDLVLLDVMLPRRDGFEVCQQIRANPALSHTQIVLLSARGRAAEVERGLALGANAYITKPFSTRELVARLRELLGE